MEQINANTQNSVEPIALNDYQRLALQEVIISNLKAKNAELREKVRETMNPGDKHTVTNAQGVQFATVSLSQPNKVAVCTDRNVLLAAAEEAGAEILDGLPPLGDERYLQIVDLLIEQGRLDLLDPEVSPQDKKDLEEKVLEDWQITGVLPAGWEIKDASAPRFAIRKGTSVAAKAIAAHMIATVTGAIGEAEQHAAIEGAK